MLEGSTVLITGGLGAIGSALARACLSRDVASLLIIDDCTSCIADLSHDILSDSRTNFFRASILDAATLDAAYALCPTVVFHLAAHFANQNSIDHPIEDCMVNSVGTMRLLEGARQSEVQKFVFASSSCVYGAGPDFSVDTQTFQLDTPYAVNKLHGEYLVRFYHEFHGMNTTVLRYFNSFGPGELPGVYRNVVPNFFALAMQGKPLPITGSPYASRDFNFVQNTVQATILAAECEAGRGKIYNVGSGTDLAIGDLAMMVNALTDNAGGVILRGERTWDHVLHRKADISKTIVDLGYHPVVHHEEHLAETYRWLQQNVSYFPQDL